MRTQPIGLIGVGLLGSALAERIAGRYQVLAFDIDPSRQQTLGRVGSFAADAKEVFAESEAVVLCLPTSGMVHGVIKQCEAELSPGMTVVDTTTGDPEVMVAISQWLKQRGVAYLEANVAGSSQQVREGSAVLFVGGADEDVTKARDLIDLMAETHFCLGPIGSASRFKLVHNLVLGLNRAVLAEGLTFADALGFDPAKTLEILTQTPAASSVMETKGPRMVHAQYDPQARLSQHLKDVLLILAEAARHGARMPLSEAHETLLRCAESRGFGEADNSAVIEAFRSAPPETDG